MNELIKEIERECEKYNRMPIYVFALLVLVVTFISSLFVFKGIEGFLFMFYIVAVMFIGMYFGKKATLNQVVSLIKKIKKEESR